MTLSRLIELDRAALQNKMDDCPRHVQHEDEILAGEVIVTFHDEDGVCYALKNSKAANAQKARIARAETQAGANRAPTSATPAAPRATSPSPAPAAKAPSPPQKRLFGPARLKQLQDEANAKHEAEASALRAAKQARLQEHVRAGSPPRKVAPSCIARVAVAAARAAERGNDPEVA
jgi:hypothetical protein